jgi:hypothetical protein
MWVTTNLPGPRPVLVGATTQAAQVETKYDPAKDITTVSLPPLRISGEKDEYYSLHVATSFDYPGPTFRAPEFFRFEIRSVVKRRKLNPDLYVVFLLDGETIHLSSNRWAVRNPVPGRRVIGEVIAMKMPRDTFLKLLSAGQAAIKMGGTRFDLSDSHRETLRLLTDKARP